jgi:SAM-dependent methyltransferase
MDFSHRDPADPAFWDERFVRDFIPWDAGAAPPELHRFIEHTPVAVRAPSVLIPGCGSGHEVTLFSEAGWEVAAIDFSAAAVARARANLGRWAPRVHLADFFTYAPANPPDLIYERAFLCALPPALWPSIVERWAALLPPGGLLAGYFYFDASPKGPPFGADPDRLAAMLNGAFEPVQDAPAAASVPVFEGKERWQVWRRAG